MGGVTLLKVTNVVSVCGCVHYKLSPYGQYPLTEGYKCNLFVRDWVHTNCPLMGGVPLPVGYKINVVFVCGWDHDPMSPYGRCSVIGG